MFILNIYKFYVFFAYGVFFFLPVLLLFYILYERKLMKRRLKKKFLFKTKNFVG